MALDMATDMATVTVAMSMSLDGFVAGPNIGHEHPLGEGGERLHDWLFNRNPRRGTSGTHGPANPINAAVAQEMHASTGAVILGRRTFDLGVDLWGDVPFPVPCFVLTHRPRTELVMKSNTFTFVDDGIESALRQANQVAGERKIMLMGADVAQQYLEAGLLDEIQVSLIPVLFGKGSRLFEEFGGGAIELEITQLLEAPDATHVIYRVLK